MLSSVIWFSPWVMARLQPPMQHPSLASCPRWQTVIYDDDGNTVHIHDRKLDALEDIIEAANGKPVLVAYWFKHDLNASPQG